MRTNRMYQVQHVRVSLSILRDYVPVLPVLWQSDRIPQLSVRREWLYMWSMLERRHAVHKYLLLHVQYVSWQGFVDDHLFHFRRSNGGLFGHLQFVLQTMVATVRAAYSKTVARSTAQENGTAQKSKTVNIYTCYI